MRKVGEECFSEIAGSRDSFRFSVSTPRASAQTTKAQTTAKNQRAEERHNYNEFVLFLFVKTNNKVVQWRFRGMLILWFQSMPNHVEPSSHCRGVFAITIAPLDTCNDPLLVLQTRVYLPLCRRV